MRRTLSTILVGIPSPTGELLASEFSNHNFTVLQVADSASALSSFQTLLPQVAIIDLDSSQYQAQELLKQLFSENPEVLLIGCSTLATPAPILEGYRLGLADFIKIPADERSVRELISRLMGLLNRRMLRIFAPDSIEEAKLDLVLYSTSDSVSAAVGAVSYFLQGVCSYRERKRLELAFDELIRNAHEHGNLAITSTEKDSAFESGTYEELVARRQRSLVGSDKRIRIAAALEGMNFACTISDDGAGFNWRKQNKAIPAFPAFDDLLSPSGRGLMLINLMFDRVEYNEKGNAVTVYKTF